MGPEVEYATNAPLTKLLRSVVRPGDYCAHGRLFLPMPTVDIAGVGLLSFPVPDSQVRALTEVAERAPYGKGTETVVDTSVRDCWQIDAARLRIGGHAWDDTFETILDAVTEGLASAAATSKRGSTNCWYTPSEASSRRTGTPRRSTAWWRR